MYLLKSVLMLVMVCSLFGNYLTSQDAPKKINIGILVNENKDFPDKSLKSWLFEKLDHYNKSNEFYNYIFIDKDINSNDIEPFQYIIEIDPLALDQSESLFNITTYIEKKVPKKTTTKPAPKDTTKTNSKTSTPQEVEFEIIKVPVYESGIRLNQQASFVGRMYDVSSGLYLNGFVVEYGRDDKFLDVQYKKDLDNAATAKNSEEKAEKIKIAEKRIRSSYKTDINNRKTSFKAEFINYAFHKIIFNTAYPFYYPQQIIGMLNQTDEKAKGVKLSGIKYLQDQKIDNVFELTEDKNGFKFYDRIAQFMLSDDYYDNNGCKVRLSAKKVLEAWENNRKMVIGKYKEQFRFLGDTIQKQFTILPVFEDFSPSPMSIYKVNYYLKDIPIFRVIDRGAIKNIDEILQIFKSENALDGGSYNLRDKLIGADYIVLFNREGGENYSAKLIETKTGMVLNKINLRIPVTSSGTINFYGLIVPAFNLNTEISDIGKDATTKAKDVYIKSLFPLKEDIKYNVMLVKNYEVDGQSLVRTIQVGEIEVDKLYSRTFAIADVKKGGKEILENFKNGEKLICEPVVEKKGFFSQIFDFNDDYYENKHSYSDSFTHGTMGL